MKLTSDCWSYERKRVVVVQRYHVDGVELRGDVEPIALDADGGATNYGSS